ncbi:hypothetical protein J2847_000953 [Azospirillum agricola]|uniref:vWA domain-containing protein n=1 Tax=Azospirillum agricola TaxID=1720247 RepID=UPI001AE48001|nr:vWA domain-containing protein [Azospirillum agricola]MBP2227671.1 hypothetical protein [Azospirillum agricola]
MMVCSQGQAVCRNRGSDLPARVLIRPLTTVYESPSRDAKVIRGNLPPFNPWFVFDRRGVDLSDPIHPKGWYRIGDTVRDSFGWIEAGNAIEWPHALIVSYTHPGDNLMDPRTPVLMFDSLDRVRAVMSAPDRARTVTRLIQAVDAAETKLEEKYGLVMVEPKRFINIESNFYILPVIAFESFQAAERSARYLRLAAAIPQTDLNTGRLAPGTDLDDLLHDALMPESTAGTAADTLNVDVKFVLDMTGSMQPYLDGAKAAVASMIRALAKDRHATMRFGLVGFTDVPQECGGCRFTTVKNWTATGLFDAETLVLTLDTDPQAQAADGGDLPETLFEGMLEAVNSRWSENAVRMVLLLGDASGNQQGTAKNRDVNAQVVRSQADTGRVFVNALHIKPVGQEADHPIAEAQFKAMAQNPGPAMPSYASVTLNPRDPAANRAAIADEVQAIVSLWKDEIEKVRRGDVSVLRRPVMPAAGGTGAGIGAGIGANDPGIRDRGLESFAAALVAYLGDAASPPTDLTGWAVDIDMANPSRKALEVRLLVEKKDLEDLTNAIERVVTALRRSKMKDSDFFQELQGIVTRSVMATEETVDSSLLPRWIDSLPYRTGAQRLTPRRYASMSVDDKVNMERELDGKLRIYKGLIGNDAVWRKLSPRHSDLEAVYAIPLTDLP